MRLSPLSRWRQTSTQLPVAFPFSSFSLPFSFPSLPFSTPLPYTPQRGPVKEQAMESGECCKFPQRRPRQRKTFFARAPEDLSGGNDLGSFCAAKKFIIRLLRQAAVKHTLYRSIAVP